MGKIMKKLLILALLTTFSISHAGIKVGGSVEHTLKCLSSSRVQGTQIGLLIRTAALAPQYNVLGIALTARPLVSGAKDKVTPLEQVSQTAYNANFKAKDIEVLLDKGTFEANLKLGDYEFSCK
jgi:hypothetical protein